MKNVPKMGKNT